MRSRFLRTELSGAGTLTVLIKTSIVLHLMTTNNKKKYEEIDQIEVNIIILKSVSFHIRDDLSKCFCIKEKESCSRVYSRNPTNQRENKNQHSI
jgi:hypothetical protein